MLSEDHLSKTSDSEIDTVALLLFQSDGYCCYK